MQQVSWQSKQIQRVQIQYLMDPEAVPGKDVAPVPLPGTEKRDKIPGFCSGVALWRKSEDALRSMSSP